MKQPHETTVLPIHLLVHPDLLDGVGEIWIARSVLTGHIAHADTPAAAVEHLQAALEGALRAALRHGQSPLEWLTKQVPDEARYIEEYRGLARKAVKETLRREIAQSDCVFDSAIVQRMAA